ncbi:MAG: glycosyltransferase [Phycisphaerales bacterium]
MAEDRSQPAQAATGTDRALPPVRTAVLVTNPMVSDARVERHARAMAAWGLDVTVHAHGEPGLPARESRGGFEIVRHPLEPGRMPIYRLNRSFGRALVKDPPELILANDLDTGPAALRVAGADRSIKLVYDAHEWFVERYHPSAWSAKRAVWRALEKRLLRRADVVITVADGIAKALRAVGGRDVRVVRNAWPRGVGSDPRGTLHRMCGADASTPIALYAGAIIEGRGLEDLIDAAAHAVTTIAIMGPAPRSAYVAELRAQAESLGVLDNGVFLIDPVPLEDFARVQSGAAAAVAPTRGDNASYKHEASNKVFAALASGIPIVTTESPDKRRLIDAYDCGVLVPARAPEPLAAAIDRACQPGPDRDRLVRGAQRASEEVCWERESDRLYEVFAGLVRRDDRR